MLDMSWIFPTEDLLPVVVKQIIRTRFGKLVGVAGGTHAGRGMAVYGDEDAFFLLSVLQCNGANPVSMLYDAIHDEELSGDTVYNTRIAYYLYLIYCYILYFSLSLSFSDSEYSNLCAIVVLIARKCDNFSVNVDTDLQSDEQGGDDISDGSRYSFRKSSTIIRFPSFLVPGGSRRGASSKSLTDSVVTSAVDFVENLVLDVNVEMFLTKGNAVTGPLKHVLANENTLGLMHLIVYQFALNRHIIMRKEAIVQYNLGLYLKDSTVLANVNPYLRTAMMQKDSEQRAEGTGKASRSATETKRSIESVRLHPALGSISALTVSVLLTQLELALRSRISADSLLMPSASSAATFDRSLQASHLHGANLMFNVYSDLLGTRSRGLSVTRTTVDVLSFWTDVAYMCVNGVVADLSSAYWILSALIHPSLVPLVQSCMPHLPTASLRRILFLYELFEVFSTTPSPKPLAASALSTATHEHTEEAAGDSMASTNTQDPLSLSMFSSLSFLPPLRPTSLEQRHEAPSHLKTLLSHEGQPVAAVRVQKGARIQLDISINAACFATKSTVHASSGPRTVENAIDGDDEDDMAKEAGRDDATSAHLGGMSTSSFYLNRDLWASHSNGSLHVLSYNPYDGQYERTYCALKPCKDRIYVLLPLRLEEGKHALVSVSEVGKLIMWDATGYSIIYSRDLQTNGVVKTATLMEDFRELWVGDTDGCIIVFNIVLSRIVYRRKMDFAPTRNKMPSILSLCCTELDVWVGGFGYICRLDRKTREVVEELEAHSHYMVSALVSVPSCAEVWSSSDDGTIQVRPSMRFEIIIILLFLFLSLSSLSSSFLLLMFFFTRY